MRAQGADHRENAGNVALVEDVYRDACANQFSDDVGLQVGKGENEIGLEIQYLWDIGGDEGGDARLLTPDLRWPHGVAGNTDDPVLLAQQVKRLDRFLGQANNAARRKLAHGRHMQNKRSLVTARRS